MRRGKRHTTRLLAEALEGRELLSTTPVILPLTLTLQSDASSDSWTAQLVPGTGQNNGSASSISTIQITPGPGLSVNQHTVSGIVGHFVDLATNNTSLLQIYTAVINWGDGTTSPGQITQNLNGGYDVSGSHSYAGAGQYALQLSVQRDDIFLGDLAASVSTNVGGLITYNYGDIGQTRAFQSLTGTGYVIDANTASGNVVLEFHPSTGTVMDGNNYSGGVILGGAGNPSTITNVTPASISISGQLASAPKPMANSGSIIKASLTADNRSAPTETTGVISRATLGVVAIHANASATMGGITAAPADSDQTTTTNDPGVFEGEFAVAAAPLPERQPPAPPTNEYAANDDSTKRHRDDDKIQFVAHPMAARIGVPAQAKTRIAQQTIDAPLAKAAIASRPPAVAEQRTASSAWKTGAWLAVALVSQSWRGKNKVREQDLHH